MADGFSLNIDDSLLKNLEKADKLVNQIADSSQKMSKTVIESFKNVNNNALKPFIENLNAIRKSLDAKAKPVVFKEINTQASQAVDKINSFISLMNKINNTGSNKTRNSAVTKINQELDDAKKRLVELQNLLNFYAKGEGRKAIGFVDTTNIQQEARALMNRIDLLEREKASIQANARLRMTIAQRQEAIDNAWYAMENKKRQETERLAKVQSDAAKRSSDSYRKSYEERYRAYQAMFDKIEGLENRNRSNQSIANKGTILYDSIYSQSGIKSIQNMRNAIMQMQDAQNQLNLKTSDGKKRYDELDAKIKQVQKDIDAATNSNNKFGESHNKLLNYAQQLRRSLALMFSVSQISGYINKLVTVRKEFELQQKSLQVLLQSKDEANKLWQQTVDLAVRSPFRVKELVTYTRQLAAYRIETNKLHDTTKRLADVSAGLGVDMQRLILAFGQVRAANFLRGTELRQFTEAGIPMLDELAKHFTALEGKAISAGEVFEMISKRMVLFEDVEAVFRRMTSEGGAFFKMQEEQSKTLAGMISNLYDSVDLMLNEIGKTYDGFLKGSINFAKFFIENWGYMADAIKGVLLALAGHKLYQLALKQSILDTARAQGVLNVANAKQLTQLQLLRVGWNQLLASMKSSAATMKSMFVFNLPLLAVTALFSGVWKLISSWREHNEELDKISENYDDLRKKIEKINVSFNIATDENDIKTQKQKLNELIVMANNDYNMKIKVDVEGMDAREIQNKFSEISQQMFDANIFAEHFAKQMQRATEWVVEDDIFEDLEQLGNKANDVLHELSLNRERIVFDLQKSQDKLNESQREALEMLKQPKQINESEVDYLERLSKGYSLVIDEYSTLQDALKNTKDASTASKLNVEFSKIQDTFKRLNIDAGSLYKLFNNYDKTIEEARIEFENFAKTLDLNENLTEEQKEIRLKTAIDKLASEKGWNDFVVNYIYRWTEEAFEIKFKPVIAEKEQLKAWQETYNRLFSGMEGFREITKNTTKQKEIIDRLNGSIKETEELINRINKAGGIKATSKGGAYEGIDLSKLNNALLELKKQRDWLGGSESGKDKDSESKILKNRISLIKELNKEYEKLNKTFDSTTSKEKVLESFGDTFKQAFEGTGISLSSMVVNTEALNDLKNTGELAGKTLSESMIKEIEQLKEAGTYIRNFDEDFLLSIKHLEGFRAEAYKDAGGVWTQGYGETINIERGKVWDEEKATMVLRDSLTKRYVSQLNEVLDDNKELVLTQKQYNALLDLTYQGGKGAAISILERTKDISKGVDYINLIASKIKETMGSKEAERFGESFVNKFKEAKSVYERIAMLLEVSNLTIKGGINKEWYKGMQKRSDERASIFRGDLETSKILQEVLVSISDIDFTNIEGVIHQLKQLAPLAKKEGKEAELALSKEISELEVQVGVKKKSEQDKELIDYIEDMFSGYEMSIELQKLNIPPDLAKQLFNIDALTLPELKNKVVSMESKFVGTDMEEEYRKFLKKIDEMEEKAQMERLKKYSKYLIKAQSERVKIKLEEMRQLAEIEKLGFNETQKEQITQSIQLETKQKMDKAEWDAFKDTDLYVQMFEDLGVVSDKVLNDLKTRLIDIRGSLSDLSPRELKEVVSQLEKVTSEQISRNPFENLGDTIDKGVKALKRLNQEQEEYSNALKEQDKTQRRVDSLQIANKQAEAQIESAKAILLSKDATIEQRNEAQHIITTNNEAIAQNNLLLDSEIKRLAAQKGITEEAAKKLILTRAEVSELNKTANSVGAWGSTITDSVSQVTSMLENWGIDFGEEFEGVLSGLGQAFGALENIDLTKPMSVISGVTGIVAGLGNAFASIFGFGNKDKKKEKQIQREIKFVEDLERAYQKLEKAIDNAYSINTLQASGQAAKKNIDAQIASYNKMIAAEEDKKKTDKDRIKEWQLAIEDLIEQKAELDKELVSVATSGIMDDVLSASQEFTNAWLEAFNETGDGLSGLESNFKETMLEMVKQQAAMLISQSYVEKWKKQLEQYINPDDLELSTDEAKKWVDAVSNSLPQLNDALTRYFEAMKQAGVDLSGGEQSELSGLQRGIQGVTEETAQIIEAYLNSIRFFVAEQTTYLSQIASSFGNTEMENPMVEQLRIIASQTTAINTLLQSLTRGGHTLGGVGLKVFIS